MIELNHFVVADVMTNTIYIENLHVLSDLCLQVGDSLGAADYLARARKARASLDELCWNETDGLYYGVNGKENKPLNVNTFMSLMPLLLSDLDKDKVDLLIARVLNPDEYWAEFPIPSVAMSHPTYRPDTVGGTLVWRGPSWMNSNWYIARGLKRHGRLDLARHIANQSIAMVQKSGFREYYNPQTAFGRGAPDFSWSTILIDLLDEVK
jgi:glycogen debranching enzyme